MTDVPLPWLERADWRNGVVRSPGAARPALPMKVAILVVAIPVVVMVLRTEDPAIIFFSFMGAIAAWIVFRFVLDWYGNKRFGPAEFRFDHVPFIVGTRLKGELVAPFPKTPPGGTIVSLECEVPGRRNESGTEIAPRQSIDGRVLSPADIARTGGRATLPVDLFIPSDEPPGIFPVVWTVSITMPFRWIEYFASFTIPVYMHEALPLVRETGVELSDRRELRKTLREIFSEPQ